MGHPNISKRKLAPFLQKWYNQMYIKEGISAFLQKLDTPIYQKKEVSPLFTKMVQPSVYQTGSQ